MVAPFGPSPGVARVVSLRSLRVPPRHYLPGTAWGKVQDSGGSSVLPGGFRDPAPVAEPDPLPTFRARGDCGAAFPAFDRKYYLGPRMARSGSLHASDVNHALSRLIFFRPRLR